MTHEISFFDLVLKASFLVQLVMLCLLSMSIASWAMIIQRRKVLSVAKVQSRRFEDRFWSGIDLAKLYNETSARQHHDGMEAIFVAGFKEFARLSKSGASSASVLEGSQRAMRVQLSRETESLEASLTMLATVGSISPYIGLFGTVWGIMNAFIALGQVQQPTLQAVAPAIAEALIATAIGLFAAIPAVIAYNRFSHQVEKLEGHYINFMEEFSNILHRQVVAKEAI